MINCDKNISDSFICKTNNPNITVDNITNTSNQTKLCYNGWIAIDTDCFMVKEKYQNMSAIGMLRSCAKVRNSKVADYLFVTQRLQELLSI